MLLGDPSQLIDSQVPAYQPFLQMRPWTHVLVPRQMKLHARLAQPFLHVYTPTALASLWLAMCDLLGWFDHVLFGCPKVISISPLRTCLGASSVVASVAKALRILCPTVDFLAGPDVRGLVFLLAPNIDGRSTAWNGNCTSRWLFLTFYQLRQQTLQRALSEIVGIPGNDVDAATATTR